MLSVFDESLTFEENYRERPWEKTLSREGFAELVRKLVDNGFFVLRD